MYTKDQIWKKLYNRWYRFHFREKPCSPAFQTFEGFYRWAIEAGYDGCQVMKRHDPKGPYSEGNCYWVEVEIKETESTVQQKMPEEWVEKWNRTVNRIRKVYGMDLIGMETVEKVLPPTEDRQTTVAQGKKGEGECITA